MNTTEDPGSGQPPVEVGQPVEPDPDAPASTDAPDDAETRGEPDVEPTAEPATEPGDPHRGPLDDDEDGRYLDPGDVRREDAERRRGQPFDQDESEADEQQQDGEDD
jgi:hypothetical protein